jgi:trimeric autotransporter adhesin
MYPLIPINVKTLVVRDFIDRSPLQLGLPRVQPIWIIRGSLLIPLALGCFALSPAARAVLPAPDGGYPNQNTAEGQNALFSLTTGINNTAVGFDALWHNTTGFSNTGTGSQALYSNTSGIDNTANGDGALYNNTTGSSNTAIGRGALFSNTTRGGNTAIGDQALYSNTTGFGNTANGAAALYSNTTGNSNTATGVGALVSNTTGIDNTADGLNALFSNTTGSQNTANGLLALDRNTTGSQNTANGFQALYVNTTGYSNTANGFGALNGNVTGSHNIALGFEAGSNLTTGSNNIDIGSFGVVAEANTIRIGIIGTQTSTFVAGISGATVAGGVGVIVDTNGHLGTVVSSERFKNGIKPMDKASEAILALKPVTFRYKHELDPDGIPQFGLVAEQVEKVNPDLVARDDQGKPYTVRYEAVNAMLLNEFLKEHRTVEEQKTTIGQLRADLAKQRKDFEATAVQQQKEIKALAAGLQQVSNQLELKKPIPRVVADNNQ